MPKDTSPDLQQFFTTTNDLLRAIGRTGPTVSDPQLLEHFVKRLQILDHAITKIILTCQGHCAYLRFVIT